MALRKCTICGIEAHTEDDLDLFVKNSKSHHGRMNRCKKCWNKFIRERRKDGRYYLKHIHQLMKQRCYNFNASNYPRYGGRDITICQEWLDDPNAFIDWALTAGFRRDLQVDRIDNDGPYSPENCRWASRQVQMRNRRVTNLEDGTRRCWDCGEIKSFEDFPKSKNKPQGRAYRCKLCGAKATRLKSK